MIDKILHLPLYMLFIGAGFFSFLMAFFFIPAVWKIIKPVKERLDKRQELFRVSPVDWIHNELDLASVWTPHLKKMFEFYLVLMLLTVFVCLDLYYGFFVLKGPTGMVMGLLFATIDISAPIMTMRNDYGGGTSGSKIFKNRHPAVIVFMLGAFGTSLFVINATGPTLSMNATLSATLDKQKLSRVESDIKAKQQELSDNRAEKRRLASQKAEIDKEYLKEIRGKRGGRPGIGKNAEKLEKRSKFISLQIMEADNEKTRIEGKIASLEAELRSMQANNELGAAAGNTFSGKQTTGILIVTLAMMTIGWFYVSRLMVQGINDKIKRAWVNIEQRTNRKQRQLAYIGMSDYHKHILGRLLDSVRTDDAVSENLAGDADVYVLPEEKGVPVFEDIVDLFSVYLKPSKDVKIQFSDLFEIYQAMEDKKSDASKPDFFNALMTFANNRKNVEFAKATSDTPAIIRGWAADDRG